MCNFFAGLDGGGTDSPGADQVRDPFAASVGKFQPPGTLPEQRGYSGEVIGSSGAATWPSEPCCQVIHSCLQGFSFEVSAWHVTAGCRSRRRRHTVCWAFQCGSRAAAAHATGVPAAAAAAAATAAAAAFAAAAAGRAGSQGGHQASARPQQDGSSRQQRWRPQPGGQLFRVARHPGSQAGPFGPHRAEWAAGVRWGAAVGSAAAAATAAARLDVQQHGMEPSSPAGAAAGGTSPAATHPAATAASAGRSSQRAVHSGTCCLHALQFALVRVQACCCGSIGAAGDPHDMISQQACSHAQAETLSPPAYCSGSRPTRARRSCRPPRSGSGAACPRPQHTPGRSRRLLAPGPTLQQPPRRTGRRRRRPLRPRMPAGPYRPSRPATATLQQARRHTGSSRRGTGRACGRRSRPQQPCHRGGRSRHGCPTAGRRGSSPCSRCAWF